MLASVGGRYSWPVLPALAAAAGLFLLSGARIGSDRVTRALDFVILALLTLIGLQMAPLPPVILHAVSPAAPTLQDAYTLVPLGAWRPISVHPAATRAGFMLALIAALLFWASREAFSHGGSRAATRVLAWIGFACALVSLAQRASAPKTLLWKWTIPDPRAAPFGPFVDRNQLATWLVLAISLVAGYLAMHVRAHMSDRLRHGVRATLVALSDSAALGVVACLGVMLLTLAATLSRSGFVALVTAAVVGSSLSRRDHMRGIWVGAAAAAALVAVAAVAAVLALGRESDQPAASEAVAAHLEVLSPHPIGTRAAERLLEDRYFTIPNDDESDVHCSGRIPKPAHSVRRCELRYPGGTVRTVVILTTANGAEVLSKP
jgi:GNAT superfamily N-acetyltransferase